jgi:hypothetical protein
MKRQKFALATSLIFWIAFSSVSTFAQSTDRTLLQGSEGIQKQQGNILELQAFRHCFGEQNNLVCGTGIISMPYTEPFAISLKYSHGLLNILVGAQALNVKLPDDSSELHVTTQSVSQRNLHAMIFSLCDGLEIAIKP